MGSRSLNSAFSLSGVSNEPMTEERALTGSEELRVVRSLLGFGDEVVPGRVLAEEGEEAAAVARRLLKYITRSIHFRGQKSSQVILCTLHFSS